MGFDFGIIREVPAGMGTSAFIGVILFLIVLEHICEILNSLDEDYPAAYDMVQTVYKELMIMGLVSFFIVMMETDPAFDDEGEPWVQAIDLAHIVLFFAALFFLVHAIYLVSMSVVFKKKYRKLHGIGLEELISDVEKFRNNPDAAHIKKIHERRSLAEKVRFKMQFYLFRDTYSLPTSFDYALYLNIFMEHYVLNLLEVGPFNRLILAVLGALNYCRIMLMTLSQRSTCLRDMNILHDGRLRHLSAKESTGGVVEREDCIDMFLQTFTIIGFVLMAVTILMIYLSARYAHSLDMEFATSSSSSTDLYLDVLKKELESQETKAKAEEGERARIRALQTAVDSEKNRLEDVLQSDIEHVTAAARSSTLPQPSSAVTRHSEGAGGGVSEAESSVVDDVSDVDRNSVLPDDETSDVGYTDGGGENGSRKGVDEPDLDLSQHSTFQRTHTTTAPGMCIDLLLCGRRDSKPQAPQTPPDAPASLPATPTPTVQHAGGVELMEMAKTKAKAGHPVVENGNGDESVEMLSVASEESVEKGAGAGTVKAKGPAALQRQKTERAATAAVTTTTRRRRPSMEAITKNLTLLRKDREKDKKKENFFGNLSSSLTFWCLSLVILLFGKRRSMSKRGSLAESYSKVRERAEKEEEKTLEVVSFYETAANRFKHIFLGGNRELFLLCVELTMLCNCVWLAFWATHYVALAQKSSDETKWQILMAIPFLSLVPLLGEVVDRTVVIAAITRFDPITFEKVIERTDEVSTLISKLSARIVERVEELRCTGDTRTKEQITKDIFGEVDIDGSGFISKIEFHQLLTVLDIRFSKEKASSVFNAIDVDNGGSISVDEFNHAVFDQKE